MGYFVAIMTASTLAGLVIPLRGYLFSEVFDLEPTNRIHAQQLPHTERARSHETVNHLCVRCVRRVRISSYLDLKTWHICHGFHWYETVSATGAFSFEAWGIAPGF